METKCQRCKSRKILCKGYCNRCYQAVKGGYQTIDEELIKRNYVENGFGILTGKQGEKWVVDIDVFEKAKKYLWSSNGGKGYGRGTLEGGQKVFIHRFICPHFKIVDHIDGDVFNNLRSNLREGAGGVNTLNCKFYTTNTSKSKIRGIHKIRNKWQVRIGGKKNRVYLGTFDDIKSAELALKKYASENGLSEFY